MPGLLLRYPKSPRLDHAAQFTDLRESAAGTFAPSRRIRRLTGSTLMGEALPL